MDWRTNSKKFLRGFLQLPKLMTGLLLSLTYPLSNMLKGFLGALVVVTSIFVMGTVYGPDIQRRVYESVTISDVEIQADCSSKGMGLCDCYMSYINKPGVSKKDSQSLLFYTNLCYEQLSRATK